MVIQEAYQPKPLAASGTVFSGAGNLAGFICTVAGTLTLRDTDASGAIVVNALPVTEGVYHPLPLAFGAGCYAALSTAQGTFCYF